MTIACSAVNFVPVKRLVFCLCTCNVWAPSWNMKLEEDWGEYKMCPTG